MAKSANLVLYKIHSWTFHCPGMDPTWMREKNFIPGLSRTIRDSWSPCFHVLFQYLNAVFKLWPEPRAGPRGTNPAMAPHPFWLWFPPTKNKHISAFNDLRLACKLGLQ